VFTAQEEQLLRKLVDLLRHLSPNRRSIVVSEALQRSTIEDGTPSLPARDAETLQVHRRIAPPGPGGGGGSSGSGNGGEPGDDER
jgi:hypothetical protein